MTGKHDERLDGRYPEFARMSLRPGVGHGVLQHVASVLLRHGIHDLADVPTCLRHGTKMMPLGRYLRRALRKVIGRDEKCPDEVLQALQAEMYALHESIPFIETGSPLAKYRKEIIKNAIIDSNMGLKWSSEARERLQKRRSL